jgi:predicted nucleic acid-binding protein
MKLKVALQGVQRLFLDTAPVIYYIDRNPTYFTIVDALFEAIDSHNIQAVTSPITLAECLILPIHQNDRTQQELFSDLLTSPDTAEFICTNAAIARQAANLRVKYNLKLPDALQIATAIVAQCNAFLTNDIALKRISEVTIFVLEELQP